MKVSDFLLALESLENIEFVLPDSTSVPVHFHITEMGYVNKKYTDCGNTFREEDFFTFQLWFDIDVEHRLSPKKVSKIAQSIIAKTPIDAEIIVEYQMKDTIGKFHLDFINGKFFLIGTKTACLAKDNCGIPAIKPKVKLSEMQNSCTPGSGCC